MGYMNWVSFAWGAAVSFFFAFMVGAMRSVHDGNKFVTLIGIWRQRAARDERISDDVERAAVGSTYRLCAHELELTKASLRSNLDDVFYSGGPKSSLGFRDRRLRDLQDRYLELKRATLRLRMTQQAQGVTPDNDHLRGELEHATSVLDEILKRVPEEHLGVQRP
jgi:hypothetical protein